MKWYFACNNQSVEFFPLIKAAVNSALKNTTLKPNFIYDGTPDELTKWLIEKGVNVIYHRLSFYNELKSKMTQDVLKIASGAYLRCDIPIIEQEDEIVLYTDCDVIFLKDITEQNAPKPKYFSCSSQFNKKDFFDFNTGVMFMNVKELKKTHNKFKEFIINNLSQLPVFDQSAFQMFYGDKNEKLDINFNHKPYWGKNDDAIVVHYHGVKPTLFTDKEKLKVLPANIFDLYNRNASAYDYYLDLFKEYYPEITYDHEGIALLKNGTYPLSKPKRPLKIRLKNFTRKRFLYLGSLFKTLINKS